MTSSQIANNLGQFANCEVMRIISRKRLLEAARAHEVRRTYPHADAVKQYTVFNIKGNDYRLISKIEYRLGLIFVKEVLTHAEYDKGNWK